MRALKGVISSLITPMKNSGNDVDLEGMGRLCEFIAGAGADALLVLGTTGEGPLLSLAERKKAANAAVQQMKGKLPVIVHTGGITARDTKELNRHAVKIGADAIAVVLPYFFKMDDDSLVTYFTRTCSDLKGFPVYLYSNPGATGNNLRPEVFGALIERMPNLAGIKISTGDVSLVQHYLSVAQGRVAVINGSDELILPSLAVGASGFVSGISTAFPELYVDLYKSFTAGDLEQARKLQALCFELIKALGDVTQITSLKKALALRGLPVGGTREPLRLLNPVEAGRLEADLNQLGLLN